MKKLKGKAMRKTLLASAALIVMGGGAYAEVSVTGTGNFGVKFDGSKSGSEALTFHHEFDIAFAASGTTDGGLTFGGSVGIDDRETGSGTADLVKLTTGNGSCYINTDTIDSAVYEYRDDDNDGTLNEGDTLKRVSALGVPWNVSRGLLAVANIDWKADTQLVSSKIDKDGKVVLPTAPGTKLSNLREYANCSKIELTRTTSGANDNNASVHIGFDVHTLTIGDGLDAGDVAAGVHKSGGVFDVGFDGIGVDDVAESLRGKTSVDVVYTGSFGLANVRVSSGGDDNWGVGFNFNVAPVTIGVGFDSNKVASIGLGLVQGPVSGRLLYSTESENDKKAYGAEIGYTISEGTSVAIVYSQSKDPAGSDMDAVGFGFSHGLGGGATLAAGIGQVNDETKADLGINMKF